MTQAGSEAPCCNSARPGESFAVEILVTEHLVQTLPAQQPVKYIMCE